MTDLKTDAEKAEEIKAWWKENGKSVLLGVGLAIAAVFGWNQWTQHQRQNAEQASALFAAQKNGANDTNALQQLKDDYSSSPYAALAALAAAKQAATSGNNEEAIKQLEWSVNHATDKNIVELSKIRLARLLISTGKLDVADKYVSGEHSGAYAALYEELKGDLHVARKQPEEAKAAYQRAILQVGSNVPPYLQMKLENTSKGNS